MINSLAALLDRMHQLGATRIYSKNLAPNDNSKNQVYLGGGFGALNVIPHGSIEIDTSSLAGSKRERPKAKVAFSWLDEDGTYLAPHTQLVLYPDYPEVRISGFLKQSERAPSHVMSVRDRGRVLVLGIRSDGHVLGYAAAAENPIALEILAGSWETIGVFSELPLSLTAKEADAKAVLLGELKRIHDLNWIPSQKLGRNGLKEPYAARNGGGYTLEAELGIRPNGDAEPDFMGWEVKQYSVANFVNFAAKSPVTLMTPEPTGGIYRDVGVTAFLKRFGYPDKSGKPDRINFGGVYSCGKSSHPDTGLSLDIEGFDRTKGKITDIDGGLMLKDINGEIAAIWSFKGLLEHWNRKHAQAVYVPSISEPSPPRYAYGSQVLLCEGTDFILFLQAVAAGVIYYDPAIKLERASEPAAAPKRRSQFRVKHQHLTTVYHGQTTVALS